MVRARSVTPKHAEVKVTKAQLMNVKTFPWDHLGTVSHDVTTLPPRHPDTFVPGDDTRETPIPRDIRISSEIIDSFGYTDGCGKCSALRRGDANKSYRHTEQCRSRIKKAMKRDRTWAARLKDVEEKKTG